MIFVKYWKAKSYTSLKIILAKIIYFRFVFFRFNKDQNIVQKILRQNKEDFKNRNLHADGL